MMQDIPNKEVMRERMGLQRDADYLQKVAEVLTTFSELTKRGVPPEEAMQASAQALAASSTPGGQFEMPMVSQEAPPLPPDIGGMPPAPPTI